MMIEIGKVVSGNGMRVFVEYISGVCVYVK